MLAMCDRRGRVWASVPGLANRARVSVPEARKAISCFLSPDPDSRTKEYEGRRIEEIDGGWRLLNHDKYRDMRDVAERKAYKADWIREKRKAVDNVDKCRPESTQAEAEAYTEAEGGKKGAKAPHAPAKKGKEKPGSRFPPDDFVPNDKDIEWFGKQNLNVNWERETIKFRTYEYPSPKRNWSRAWRNWMLKAQDFKEQRDGR